MIPYATLTATDLAMLGHLADTPGACVDFLLDRDTPVPLGDVLLAFAGNQEQIKEPAGEWEYRPYPGGRDPVYRTIEPFTLGLPRDVLWMWLKATEPKTFAFAGTCYRWELVANTSWGEAVDGDRQGQWWISGCGKGAVWYATESAAIRDVKRRVLGLFPEVTWTVRKQVPENHQHAASVCVPVAEVALHKTSNGAEWGLIPGVKCRLEYLQESGVWHLMQTIAAPNLVPPEPRAYDAVTEGNFRQALQQIAEDSGRRVIDALTGGPVPLDPRFLIRGPL